mmetsp:Transcript_31005/g.60581  ORF Transcript_31005/g.60581 Transcript_31005/m.60581 type:complete len:195 (+) Transcript_31005:30-614(+)
MRSLCVLLLVAGCEAFTAFGYHGAAAIGRSGPGSPATAGRKGTLGLCARQADIDTMPDPYQVLGVPRTATPKIIKAAYRSKAAKYHPDVNQAEGAQEVFIDINNAFEILGDVDLRRRYDMKGRAGLPDDFAERIELARKYGGTGYVRAAEAVDKAMSDDKLAILLNVVPAVIFLSVMSFAPDLLHDLVLGPSRR